LTFSGQWSRFNFSANSSARHSLCRVSKIIAFIFLIMGLKPIFIGTEAAAEKVTVGTLKFWSVDWLVDVIKTDKLDAKEGFTIDTLMLSS